MVEGKESAAFAMPFCAGTVTGVLLSDGPVSGLELPVISVSAALAAVCLSLSAILVSDPYSPTSSPLRCCAAFFAGIFCAFSHSLSSGGDFGPGVITMTANESAAWLKNVIENFPFSNPDCNALASALVTGERRMLSDGITESFRITGASHLLALSGMHLSIIYMVMAKPFTLLRRNLAMNLLRFAVIVSSTLFYTLMTGASPSTVRALIFIVMSEAAVLSGRKRKPVTALCTAFTVQCALSPWVIRSASFQLSYLAVCGIIFLYPKMTAWFPDDRDNGRIDRLMKKIWDSAALTISCQIFTGPLAWLLFDSAPPYFLIANLIAVPLTTLGIFATVILTVAELTGIFPGLAAVCTEFILNALISTVDIISGL